MAKRGVFPPLRVLAKESVLGLAGAVSRIPDGMAAAVVAGISPAHGLYSAMVGSVVGGLTVSTALMVVTTTTAAALVADAALTGLTDEDRTAALFLITLLAGLCMIAAGLLRLGRYTWFVSHSVMIGFLTGIAVNIALGQLGNLTGTTAEGTNAIAKAWSVLSHPGAIQEPSLLIGLSAIALIVVLGRTRLAVIAAPAAVALPTAAAILLGLDVTTVADTGEFPQLPPAPVLPDLGLLSLDLVTAAASVAVIVLVQGAVVSESVPNPGGRSTDVNRDFTAQGLTNAVVGLFQGQPVGGSVGQTALSRSIGVRTRWASVFSGVWILLILIAFAEPIGLLAMPVLAGLLVYAAAGAIRPVDISAIMRTGNVSRIAMLVTFTTTLLLPLPAAVGLSVAISLTLQLNRDALDLKVVQLRLLDDGRMREGRAPSETGSHQVTVLDVYGSLLYAGSRTLASKLPDPAESHHAVVVLRLRGRTSLGATFFRVIGDYARALGERDGKLYLSGLSWPALARLRNSGIVTLTGPVRLFPATDFVGESTSKAVDAAQAWLVEHAHDGGDGADAAGPPERPGKR